MAEGQERKWVAISKYYTLWFSSLGKATQDQADSGSNMGIRNMEFHFIASCSVIYAVLLTLRNSSMPLIVFNILQQPQATPRTFLIH